MVRDAILLRLYHPQVQEKFLDEGDKLTLEKAIQIGQNHETSHASLMVIGDDEDAKVHAVRPYSRQKKQRGTEKGQGKPTPKSSQAEARGSAKTTAGACSRCGYPSTHRKCPATDKECIRCHKRGHFAKVCRSKVKPSRPRKLHTGDARSSDEEYAHLVNAGTDRDAKLGRWWAVVKIDNAHSVKVQLDNGASKSLLPYNLFRKMNVRSAHNRQAKWTRPLPQWCMAQDASPKPWQRRLKQSRMKWKKMDTLHECQNQQTGLAPWSRCTKMEK